MPARNSGPTDKIRNMAATSADHNQTFDTAMTGAEEESRAPESAPRAPTAERTRPTSAQWIESLRRSDVTRLWTELHRVVCSHPLVRASYSAGLLVEGGERGNAYVDLTQELFVTLLSKARFQHYLDTEMTDVEIECEIGQIELTNLLTAELRKRHPESYRLARRISTIIQSSPNFRRFDPTTETEHRRLADRVYGLSEWPDTKSRRGAQELEQRANPEQGLLRRESEREAAGYVDQFLKSLHTSVRGESKQYDRMLGVLWHCYLSPDHVTQLEAAARLGVSDSLVSDYRRRIEQQLRALAFSEIEQARRFEISLRERVRALVLAGDEASVAV